MYLFTTSFVLSGKWLTIELVMSLSMCLFVKSYHVKQPLVWSTNTHAGTLITITHAGTLINITHACTLINITHAGTLINITHAGTLINITHAGTLINITHAGTLINTTHAGTLINITHAGTLINMKHWNTWSLNKGLWLSLRWFIVSENGSAYTCERVIVLYVCALFQYIKQDTTCKKRVRTKTKAIVFDTDISSCMWGSRIHVETIPI